MRTGGLNLKTHCLRHHKSDEITEDEINRRLGVKPRAKPASKAPPKVSAKAGPKCSQAPSDAPWPPHPLDTDVMPVGAVPPAGPAPVLLVPDLSDSDDENLPVDHAALLEAWRQRAPDNVSVVVSPHVPQLLDCPDPACLRRAANGFKSKGGRSRHVNVNHPELADEAAPEYNDANFAAKRGLGPVETPHHILAECTAAVICELRLKYFPDAPDNSLCLPRTARFFRDAIETLQPKTSADDT